MYLYAPLGSTHSRTHMHTSMHYIYILYIYMLYIYDTNTGEIVTCVTDTGSKSTYIHTYIHTYLGTPSLMLLYSLVNSTRRAVTVQKKHTHAFLKYICR